MEISENRVSIKVWKIDVYISLVTSLEHKK